LLSIAHLRFSHLSDAAEKPSVVAFSLRHSG
jgi:hypothetical protein